MSELFDEISRIVGSRIPRRQALKLIAAGFSTAVFSSLGLEVASGRSQNTFTCDRIQCSDPAFSCTFTSTINVDKCDRNSEETRALKDEASIVLENMAKSKCPKGCERLIVEQKIIDDICVDSKLLKVTAIGRFRCQPELLRGCITDKDCVAVSTGVLQTCPGPSCSGCCGSKCCKDNQECNLTDMRCVDSNMRPTRRRKPSFGY